MVAGAAKKRRPFQFDAQDLSGILANKSARRGVLKYSTMKSLISYLKNVRGEFAHIVWPKPRQALIHTGLILLISVIVGLFIGLLDYVFTSVVGTIVNR